MKKKIIIIGGGGHAKVLIHIIKKNKSFNIIGYIDPIDHGKILGVRYLGDDNKLFELFKNNITNAAIGIGQVDLNEKRIRITNKVKEIGYTIPPIISSKAVVNEDVQIDEGVQVFDGVIINSGSIIHSFSIINTNATIEHDCNVGKFCHIATSATICGGVEVDDKSMVGSGAVIVQYKKIASNVLIGSGGVVIKDIIEPGIYVGNPVRKVK